MSTGDDVVVVRELTGEEQRAMVAQCSRCVLRDAAGWLASGLVVGTVVGLLAGEGIRAVAGPAAVVAALAAIQVIGVRSGLRRQLPVGMQVRTVLSAHRLTHVLGSYALPQVTGIGPEGRLLRLDHGKDHSHLLPDHVDADAIRQRAGVPAPAPVPGPDSVVVEVPGGLGVRVARRLVVWRALRGSDVIPVWVLAVVTAVLGLVPVAAALGASQLAALVTYGLMWRREFDRTFVAGIPTEVQWRGWTLWLRNAEGLHEVDLNHASSGVLRGDLFVVRQAGAAPAYLPAVVVSDHVRTELARTN